VQAFVVSPWQSKREASAAGPEAQPEQQQQQQQSPRMYSVVSADMLATRHSQAAADAAPAAAVAAAASRPPVAHTKLISGGAWHTRKKHPKTAAADSTPQQGAGHGSPCAEPPSQLQQQQEFTAASEPSADATEADTDEDNELQSEAMSEDWLDQAAPTDATAAAAAAREEAAAVQASNNDAAALRGVAQLALHPSGAITGHFVALNNPLNSSSKPNSTTAAAALATAKADHSKAACKPAGGISSSSRLCLGLQGRQVLGIHSCYRDPEWALLQLSVIRCGSSGSDGSSATAAAVVQASQQQGSMQDAAAAAAGDDGAAVCFGGAAIGSQADADAEAVAWVQRMGGDLVTLVPADFDDEDTEIAVRAENMGELPANVTVTFSAHTLLAGAAAASILHKTQPELLGNPDVVLNLGDMSISGLPVGFLGSS
jgi:hypothetical protein